ncbi:uncharacterized protein LOC134484566 isoform X5 [Rattus norvegicus]|uniref:uncharacterized protein LOC134484566 isoform X5 n=1 Tax=Rattus norvegicus TaxID=10116 RepID=UPI002FD7B812
MKRSEMGRTKEAGLLSWYKKRKKYLVLGTAQCTELLEKLLNILKTFGQMMTDILLMLNCDKRSKKHFVVSVSSTYNLNLKEENYWANPNSETFLEVVHMLVHMCNTCMPTVQEVEEGVRFRDAEITATCELSTGSLEEQVKNGVSTNDNTKYIPSCSFEPIEVEVLMELKPFFSLPIILYLLFGLKKVSF